MPLHDHKDGPARNEHRSRSLQHVFFRNYNLKQKNAHAKIAYSCEKPSAIKVSIYGLAYIDLRSPKYKPGIKKDLLSTDSDPSYIELDLRKAIII
jgi:hypothetical protein